MAAISKAWVTIADAAVDPDSPLDTTLMEGLRDNDINLREWLGGSFTAGAVKDHNHDGANSALIEVGPNLLRNGSFENDGAGWTITDYTGGSHAFSTSVRHHGQKSLSFTSTSTANGGGDAVSNEFIPVAENAAYNVAGILSASAANISARVQVIWYDVNQSQISAENVYDSTNTPTAATPFSAAMVAPATARFAKIKLIGGVPGAGSATGTIYFDNLTTIAPPVGLVKLAQGEIGSAVAALDIDIERYGSRFRHLRVVYSLLPSTDGVGLNLRVSVDGGSTFLSGSNYNYSLLFHYDDNAAASRLGNNGSTTISLSGTDVGNGSAEGIAGFFDIYDFVSTALWAKVSGFSAWQNSGASLRYGSASGGGAVRAADDVTDLRLLFASGNIASGAWALYGWN